MAEKKNETFTVTDRRLFTADGELRSEVPEPEVPEEETPTPAAQPKGEPEAPAPTAPTAAEQRQQADAYQKSSEEMDRQVELNGHSAKDL